MRYADIRPHVVPDSLEELHGPSTGELHLPLRLDWGPTFEQVTGVPFLQAPERCGHGSEGVAVVGPIWPVSIRDQVEWCIPAR
jgi:hypothetical protein